MPVLSSGAIPIYDAFSLLNFDGTANSVVEVSHQADFEISQGTVAFSFLTNNTGAPQGLFSKDASGFAGGGNHFVVYLDGTTLKARFQDGANSVVLEHSGIQAGVEYEFAATFGLAGPAIWVDGQLVDTATLVMDWSQNVEAIQWGGRGWASSSGQLGFDAPFNGVIANAQIYDIALSPADIAELASASANANDAPIANDDSLTVNEDGFGSLNPVLNDSDPEGETVTLVGVSSAPSNGMATVNPDGTITYVPNPNYFGPDSFGVEVTDGTGIASSVVNVTVNPVADNPVANDDTFGFDPAFGNLSADAVSGVLANDVDPDGGQLSATVTTEPTKGTLTFNPDGSFTYEPGLGFDGVDGFIYELMNENGAVAMATVTINEEIFTAPNVAPSLTTGNSTFEKVVVDSTMTATHVAVAADLDGDGDVDLVSTSELDNTVAWFENDGSLGFTKQVIDDDVSQAYPASVADIDGDGDIDILAGGYGSDEFLVYLNDGIGNFAAPIRLASNGAHSIFAADMDSDGDFDLITSSQDANQAAWYENDGNENFTLRVIDEGLKAAKTAIAIDLDGDGDMDVVSTSNADDAVYWYENEGTQSFTRRAIDLDQNGAYFAIAADIDDDGDVDVISVGQNSNTLAWYVNDGAENFTKIVIDNAIVGARSVASADIDLDGDIDLVAAARDGNKLKYYTNDGTGAFTIGEIDSSIDGIYGVDLFDVNRDGLPDVLSGARDLGEVAVFLQSKTHKADLDQGTTLLITDALLKATDVDNTAAQLSYTLLTTTTAGEMQRDGIALTVGDNFTQEDIDEGLLNYVNQSSDSLADGFTFSLSDGGSDGNAPIQGSFDFNISPQGPIAGDDIVQTLPDAELTIDLAQDLLANDVDLQGDPFTFAGFSQPANGTLIQNPDGNLTYQPDAGYEGFDNFTYTITDGTLTDTATVTVEVGLLPVPVFSAIDVVTFSGTNADVIQDPHTADFGIAEGTIAFTFNAANTTGAQGLFTKDASGFAGGGNHFVAYLEGSTLNARIQDGVNSTTLQIDDINATTSYDFLATFGANGSDIYLDGVLVATSELIMDWTNNVEYIQWGARGWGSASGAAGFDAPFSGTISDRYIFDRVLTVEQIAALNGPGSTNGSPIAVDDMLILFEDTSASFDPSANDTDPDGDTISTISIASGPSNGSAVLNPDGTVTYTPDADFFGADSFDVRVSDGNGGTAVSATTVAVTGQDDDPVAVDDTATTVVDNAVMIDLLANDVDVDGDTLTIFALTDPTVGVVVDNGDGTVIYTPNAGFVGTDTFDYSISDGAGVTSTATVDLTVSQEEPFPTPVLDIGGVSDFAGSNAEVINIAHDPTLAIPFGTISFSFIDSDPNVRQGLVTKDASGFVGGGNHFAVYLDDGNLVTRFQDGTDSAVFVFENIIAGQEYEVAAVFGTGVELWVDGLLIGADADFTTDWTTNEEYLQIGGLGWGSSTGNQAFKNALSGQMADVAIYDTRLDVDQIQTLAADSSFDL